MCTHMERKSVLNKPSCCECDIVTERPERDRDTLDRNVDVVEKSAYTRGRTAKSRVCRIIIGNIALPSAIEHGQVANGSDIGKRAGPCMPSPSTAYRTTAYGMTRNSTHSHISASFSRISVACS